MKKLRVAIDATPLETGHKVRGMGFYVRNLVEALKKDSNIKLLPTINHQPPTNDFCLLHIPYFDLFFPTLKIPKSTPTVVTVPDVIPLIYPKHYPPGMRGRINLVRQKHELKKASSIITISETSKKDIVRFLGVPQEKIFVTYLAPGNKLPSIINDQPSIINKLPEKFVLYIGDVNYNKNILRLVVACKKINIPLVIVGKQAASEGHDKSHPENRQLVELQEKYGRDKDVIRLGFLEEKELAAVWSRATVYCQPSLYEGFGLPVLEAFQAKVPVVSARTQALVEVAKDAAVYFDPHSVSDIAKQLEQVLKDTKMQRSLVARGEKRLKSFSWAVTAQATIKVYKQNLKHPL